MRICPQKMSGYSLDSKPFHLLSVQYCMKFIYSIIVVLLVSCTANTQEVNNVSIKTHDQFLSLSSTPLYQKYGQVASVKIVYDNDRNKLHFISSARYDYHYEYCMSELGYSRDLEAFNKESYSDDNDRRFLIANINYYKALDQYALELGPSDRMNLKYLELLFDKVKNDVFFGDQLVIMLNTVHVNELPFSKRG